jgi:pimeloyl-ACP methyl ester carboxylesterase
MSALDPVSYLSQGKFHKSILCKRTNSRVTYALIGDWDEVHYSYYSPRPNAISDSRRPIILYILPSGCSRYMGVLLDGIACAHGQRMVAIDRPGAGGTAPCSGKDRMTTSTQQTISVLEILGYGQSKGMISILTHSAGWLYALDLLSIRFDLFTPSSKIVFSSPFVPTLFSGNIVLSLLPKGLVELLPSASSLFQFCGNSIAWSTGIGQDLGLLGAEKMNKEEPTEQKMMKDERIRKKSQARHPAARFHPPYTPHSSLALEAWKESPECYPSFHPKTGRKVKDGQSLLFEYFISEGGVKACTEDFLLCLGKVEGMNNVAMEKWAEEKMKLLASLKAGDNISRILVIWCEKDFMIPSKGRKYMDSLFEKTGLAMDKWVMADGGHDAGIASKEVMDDIFTFLGGN